MSYVCYKSNNTEQKEKEGGGGKQHINELIYDN